MNNNINLYTWANIIEQIKNYLFYYLQFIHNHALEEYQVILNPYQEELFSYGNRFSYFVPLIDLMKEYGISERFLNELAKKDENKIPLWIKQKLIEIINDLKENNISEEKLADALELLREAYNY